jgi:hypothetical protein
MKKKENLHGQQDNGRESTVNRLLDGSIYPGEKLVPFSLNFLRMLRNSTTYT